MKAIFLIGILVCWVTLIGTSYAWESPYTQRVNVTPSVTAINTSFVVNLSMANITCSYRCEDVYITDGDDKQLPYQTFVNGIWYYKGVAHNLSISTQQFNVTYVFLNKTVTTVWAYIKNSSSVIDRSESILALDDDFSAWQVTANYLPTYMKSVGSGSQLCTRGGKVGICPKFSGGAQHFDWYWNVSNPSGSTLNFEYGQFNLTSGSNDLLLVTYETAPLTGGYRSPQESTNGNWYLRTLGDTAIGNSSYSGAMPPDGQGLNITIYRADKRIGMLFRNSTNKVITHIGADDTSANISKAGEQQGTFGIFLSHLTFYNRTVDLSYGGYYVNYGPQETQGTCTPTTPIWSLNLADNCTVTGTYSIGNIFIYGTGYGHTSFINLNLTYSNLSFVGQFINYATLTKSNIRLIKR
jgi:hypothetical protein